MTRPDDPASTGEESTTPVRPGALTALILDMLRLPDCPGWERSPAPGEVIGRFEISREIGRGGFGAVYEAFDSVLSRAVALKTVRAAPREGARALAEAEAAARLAHPNIVHLYDVGRTERGPYLVMELLRGETLAARLERGSLGLRQAVGIAVEIARGIAHAHGQGVVHRDLKPANVFLCDDGQVKILDFGLARVFGLGGAAGGTPRYMAPEQARGEAGDERADIFSLGVMFDELFSSAGEPLRRRSGPRSSRLPLRRLVEEMSDAAPAKRPAAAANVLSRLLAVQRGLEPRPWLWASWAVAAAAVVLAVGLGLRGQPLPAGRLVVAVADTDNATGERDLDGASELLQAGLGESRRVSIVSRSALVNELREARRPVPSSIRETDARFAAERVQAHLLALPAVRRIGDGYEVSVRLGEVADGRVRHVGTEPAAAALSVPAALHRLVIRIRRSLSETVEQVPEAPVDLADVAPATPHALGLYAEGRRLVSMGRFLDALVRFKQSIDADPGFLLARVGALETILHQVNNVLTGDTLAIFPALAQRENLEVLRRSLARIPRGDRVFVEFALQCADSGTAMERVAAAERAVESSPEDPRFPLHAAWLLLWLRADVAAARPHIERALRAAALAPEHALLFLLYLERTDEALARARRWVDEEPSGKSWYWLSEAHRQRGELAAGLEAARQSLALPDGIFNQELFVDADALEDGDALYRRGLLRDRYAWMDVAASIAWASLRGRPREALAIASRIRPEPGTDPYRELVFHVLRAHVYTPLGDRAAMFRELHGMLEAGSAAFLCEAWALAVLGDVDRAELLASNFIGDKNEVCVGMARAVALWKRGDLPGALAILERYPIGTSDFYRAEIFAAQGRDAQALEALRRYRCRRGLNFFEGFLGPYNSARSLFLEARSQWRLGHADEARRALARFFRLWERAEPGLPLLAEARALQEAIGLGASRSEARP